MDPLIEAEQTMPSFAETTVPARTRPTDDPVRALEHYHRYLYASRFVRNKRVLDIACGDGYGTAFLSINAEEVVGVDADDALITEAKKRTAEFPKTRFEAQRVEEFSSALELFDVVVSFGTVERLATDAREKFLANIRQCLKPGGILVISASISDGRLEDIGDRGESRNPEFSAVKFSEFLKSRFKSAIFLGQKPVTVSSLWSLYQWQDELFRFHTRENLFTLPADDEQFAVPHSLVAVCSDEPLSREIADSSKSIYYDTAQVKRTQEIVLRSRRLEYEVETLRESVASLMKEEAGRIDLLLRLQNEGEELREMIDEKKMFLEERNERITMLENDLANAHAANDTLQQAYDLRSARAATLKEEHTAVSARIQELQTALAERENHIEKLTAESEQYRTSLLSVQEELNNRTAQLTHDRGALERARLQASELTAQREEHASLATLRSEEIHRLENQLADLHSHISERGERERGMIEMMAEKDETILRLQHQIEEERHDSRVKVEAQETLRVRNQELEELLARQNNEFTAKEEEFNRLNEVIETLRRESEASTLSVEARCRELDVREQELEGLAKLADELMAEAEKKKSESGVKEEEIALLNMRLNDQAALAAMRSDEILALNQKIEDLHRADEEKAGAAEKLKKELEHYEQQINSLHREQAERTQKIAQFEVRVKEQAEFLTKIQRECEEQTFESRRLRGELERQMTAFDAYHKSQSDLQQRYTKSQIRVQELQANITMFEQKLRQISQSSGYKVFSSLGLFPKHGKQ